MLCFCFVVLHDCVVHTPTLYRIYPNRRKIRRQACVRKSRVSRDEDENGNIGLEVSPGKFFKPKNLVHLFGGGLGLNNNLNPFMPKDILNKSCLDLRYF